MFVQGSKPDSTCSYCMVMTVKHELAIIVVFDILSLCGHTCRLWSNPVLLPVPRATLDQTHVRLPPRASGQPMKALVCHTELYSCWPCLLQVLAEYISRVSSYKWWEWKKPSTVLWVCMSTDLLDWCHDTDQVPTDPWGTPDRTACSSCDEVPLHEHHRLCSSQFTTHFTIDEQYSKVANPTCRYAIYSSCMQSSLQMTFIN